jgi:hypothetical protein
MASLYFILAAAHLLAIVVTGILWTILDLSPRSGLKAHFRDIRAVHFGSLYLVPWFLGLAYAFERLGVPAWHQVFFPAGLGLLVFFAGVAYLLPRPPGLDPFYYWTRGWAMVLSLIGLACLVFALLWTAAVLTWYAVPGLAWTAVGQPGSRQAAGFCLRRGLAFDTGTPRHLGTTFAYSFPPRPVAD